MSILSDIFHKIFPSNHPANTSPTTPSQPAVVAANAATAATPAPLPEVDITQVLEGMAAKAPEKLNWQTSIVDLMKLLGIDSSLAARKSLAQELHFSGALDGSAEMNLWLHKQVMNRVAANGGKVPADLKD